MRKLLSFIVIFLLGFVACSKDNVSESKTTLNHITALLQYSPSDIETHGVLIGTIRWATRNVNTPGTFTANPEDAGMFYQFNKRVGWSNIDPVINTDCDSVWENSRSLISNWETANDPCPTGWRVPTRAELNSLKNTVSTWTTNWNGTGVSGRTFGTAPYQIFLPAAGYRYYGMLLARNTWGYYWSRTSNGTNSAWNLWLGSGNRNIFKSSRTHGFSVRCVTDA